MARPPGKERDKPWADTVKQDKKRLAQQTKESGLGHVVPVCALTHSEERQLCPRNLFACVPMKPGGQRRGSLLKVVAKNKAYNSQQLICGRGDRCGIYTQWSITQPQRRIILSQAQEDYSHNTK